MDVFISWSGDHSRQVAAAVAEWLPAVLQRVRPFVSDKDIHSGARWQAEVTAKLEDCTFGILIVTAENQSNPWLQFEAGALSKAVNDSRVVPLLVDLKKSDLLLPLNMFQAELLDEPGIASLLAALNKATSDPMPDGTVGALAKKWWPDLAEQIEAVKVPEARPSPDSHERTDRELLEELVTMVRSMRNSSLLSWSSDDEAVARLLKRSSAASERPVKIEIDTPNDRRRSRDLVRLVKAALQDEGFPEPAISRSGPDSFEVDMEGRPLQKEVADSLGRRALKYGLGLSFINIAGEDDLEYDGHLL